MDASDARLLLSTHHRLGIPFKYSVLFLLKVEGYPVHQLQKDSRISSPALHTALSGAHCTSPIVLVHQGTHRCSPNRCEAQRIKNAANRYRPVSASRVICRSARHGAEHFAKQLHNKLSLDAKPTLRQTQGLPESPDAVALRERQAVGEALPLDSAQLSLHAAAEVQKGRHFREAERLVDGGV